MSEQFSGIFGSLSALTKQYTKDEMVKEVDSYTEQVKIDAAAKIQALLKETEAKMKAELQKIEDKMIADMKSVAESTLAGLSEQIKSFDVESAMDSSIVKGLEKAIAKLLESRQQPSE